ncbi:MAG: BamA/TamA family outer membrane protein, partial [Cystobacter sp.]
MPLIRTPWRSLVLAVLVSTGARASQHPPPPLESPPTPPPARTGWGVQGLPLINYNSDEGLGYGARLLVVDSGDGTLLPYRYAFMAQFFQTTVGVAMHRLSLDAPRLWNSPWRVGVDLSLLNDRFSPYYGPVQDTRYTPSFNTCDDRDALKADANVCPGNPDFRGVRYYAFDQRTFPSVLVNLRRALSGPWQVALGYRFRYTTLRTRYGADDLGQAGDSRLEEDVRAGRVPGLTDDIPAGGRVFRTAEVTASLLWDLRDNEPAPVRGMFHELAVRGAAGVTGSAFDYYGITTSLRFYHPLGTDRLVAALRLLVDVMGGDVPFTQLTAFGGVEWRETMSGLGGVSTLRGVLKNRLRGQVKGLANGELRWKVLSVAPGNQHLDFTLLAFLDVGQAWESLAALDTRTPRYSGGGGLRIAWEENFIVRLDYGVSP